MKTSVSSFDLRVLVAEWQGLIGGHVDKVYQREDEVIFRITVPDRGQVELYSKAGCWLCLDEVEEKPGSPPPFAQTLRRLLDNARLTAVEQQGFDRIAVFRLERGPDRFDIIFEIFRRGNLVVGREGKTVAVLPPPRFKDRAVELRDQYLCLMADMHLPRNCVRTADLAVRVRDRVVGRRHRRVPARREPAETRREDAAPRPAPAGPRPDRDAVRAQVLRTPPQPRPPPHLAPT